MEFLLHSMRLVKSQGKVNHSESDNHSIPNLLRNDFFRNWMYQVLYDEPGMRQLGRCQRK